MAMVYQRSFCIGIAINHLARTRSKLELLLDGGTATFRS
jgi:hypothetical protein